MRRCKRWAWLWWIGWLALGGCAYYSFTGAAIPPHLQTIAIPLVEDRSNSPFTNLDQQLTELLIERFVNQTRLTLEPDPEAADALLEVRIDRYTNEPTAIGGAERAERNRVTITVTVRYMDQVNDQVLLERSFFGLRGVRSGSPGTGRRRRNGPTGASQPGRRHLHGGHL